MPPDLADYLCREAARPFARPDDDCCFMAATWVLERTGIDPAADLRDAYHDARGALRLIRTWGGFETMWSVHMALAGFNLTARPTAGDVGVLRDRAGQTVAGIRVGTAWAMKAARGVLIEDVPCIAAWSLARG